MGRLLFIGAHPDDETFFAAGTFAKYTAAGHKIRLICATRGQSGKTGDLCTREELPAVREQELQNAMAILGVNDIEILPYQDRELASAPVEEMRRTLVRSVRNFQPDVVITFDPQGANHHPDHIAISRFTSDALSIAEDPRWFPELGESHCIKRLLWTPPTFIFRLDSGRNIRTEPGFDFLINVEEVAEQKSAAFRAHATQFPGLKKLFFDDENGRRTFGMEGFRLAWGAQPAKLPCPDLFAD